MKRQQKNIHDVLGAFVNEDNHEEFLNSLYPLLSVKGKAQVKDFWSNEVDALSISKFETICEVAAQVTGVDFRKEEKKNKETSLSQFLVCYALYYEYVARKKVTLKELCKNYLFNLKHPQVLYSIAAIEKKIKDKGTFAKAEQFAVLLAEKQMVRTHQRLLEVIHKHLRTSEVNNG